MINSIPKIESNNANTFGKVTVRTNPSDYWLEKPKPQSLQTSQVQAPDLNVVSQPKLQPQITDATYLASSPYLDKIKIITPEEARKTNNIKIIGLSIAGATVLTAGTIFFLLKGGPKGLSKSFNSLRTFLDKRVQKAKLDGNNVLSTTDKVYVYALDKLNKLQERSGVINNYNTVKDLLFKKMMGWNKYLAKFHDKITRGFERLGRQAVVNTYKKTDGLLQKATNTALSAPLVSNSSKNKLLSENAEVINLEIGLLTEKFFGQNALRSRYFSFKSAIETLKQAFSNMKVFLSKDLYTKFMADSRIIEQRDAVIKTVLVNRRELSYPLSHLAKDSEESIMKMVSSLSFKDTERLTSLRSIRAMIKKLAKCKNPQTRQELTNKIVTDMDSFIQNISEAQQSKLLPEKNAKALLAEMTELRANIVGYKPGKVEELLSIYKQILSKSDYKKVETAYKAWLKSLDKSIKIETEDFMNKLRDLAMGSAPTDILTVLGSLGILGYNLAKSKDNDQRTSIALKYGIPALAGIGGSLYFNAKLFAGSKALICGSLLSFAINRLGTWADNTLKKYKQAKHPNVENPPKTV